MKITRKLMLAPLAFSLLPLLQGCGSSPATGVESIVMSRDEDGTDVTTTFKPTDHTIYAKATLNGTGNGAKVKAVWTLVNAGGEKDQKIVEKELTLDGPLNVAKNFMTVQKDFPVGTYKTDIYFNGKLDKTAEWEVK
ncbi:hypothetical protein IAD21_02305 [Abditibacteriota bacterium]|nr:hypothetical protein IAD21_02305 [Abditibacteriota bacterium]